MKPLLRKVVFQVSMVSKELRMEASQSLLSVPWTLKNKDQTPKLMPNWKERKCRKKREKKFRDPLRVAFLLLSRNSK